MISTSMLGSASRRLMLPLCMVLLLFPPRRQPVLGKFELLLANNVVEAFHLNLPPAAHVRLRQNIYDVVVIALQDSTLTVVPVEGASKEVPLNSGDVRVLRSNSVQELANSGGVASQFVVVALKSHGVAPGECGCSGEVEQSICGCSSRHLPQLWALSIGGATLAGVSLEPQQAFAGASYREDSLLVSLTQLDLQDQHAPADNSALSLGPGEVKWLSRGERQFKNVGAQRARFITIEF